MRHLDMTHARHHSRPAQLIKSQLLRPCSYDGGVTEEAAQARPGRRSYPRAYHAGSRSCRARSPCSRCGGWTGRPCGRWVRRSGCPTPRCATTSGRRTGCWSRCTGHTRRSWSGTPPPADASAVGVIVEAARGTAGSPSVERPRPSPPSAAGAARRHPGVRARPVPGAAGDAGRPDRAGQRAGRIAADIDPLDAAALVIAASDGLQIQWLLDPGAVDVGRSLSILSACRAAAETRDSEYPMISSTGRFLSGGNRENPTPAETLTRPAGGGRSRPRSGWAGSPSRPGARGCPLSRRPRHRQRPRSGCSSRA